MEIQPIDTLQIILERMYDAEDTSKTEFSNSFGYQMAIKDLARILGLDPNIYGFKNK